MDLIRHLIEQFPQAVHVLLFRNVHQADPGAGSRCGRRHFLILPDAVCPVRLFPFRIQPVFFFSIRVQKTAIWRTVSIPHR